MSVAVLVMVALGAAGADRYAEAKMVFDAGQQAFEAGEFEKEEAWDPSSLRSKLLLSSPVVAYDYFYLDRYFHRSLNLLRLPESTTLKCMKDFEEGLGSDYGSLLAMSPRPRDLGADGSQEGP